MLDEEDNYRETGDVAALHSAAQLKQVIDAGAARARVNRAVENAYRAKGGLPPLTTPLPSTVAELEAATAASAANAAKVAEAAARLAAEKADPFGLRAEASATRPADH